MKGRRSIPLWIQGIALLGCAWFLISKFGLGSPETLTALQAASPGLMASALPLVMLSLLLNAAGWGFLLQEESALMSVAQTLSVYFYSSLTRYVPGTLWYLGTRTALGRKSGIADATLLLASFVEAVLKVVTGVALAVIGCAAGVQLEWSMAGWFAAWAAAGVLLLVLVFLAPAGSQSLAPRLTRNAVRQVRRLRVKTLALSACCYALAWVLQGAALFTVANSFTGIPLSGLARVIVAYAAAWLTGFLNPLTPGGLGAREAVLAASLGLVLSPASIVAASLVLRGLTLLGEVSLALGSSFFTHRSPAPPA